MLGSGHKVMLGSGHKVMLGSGHKVMLGSGHKVMVETYLQLHEVISLCHRIDRLLTALWCLRVGGSGPARPARPTHAIRVGRPVLVAAALGLLALGRRLACLIGQGEWGEEGMPSVTMGGVMRVACHVSPWAVCMSGVTKGSSMRRAAGLPARGKTGSHPAAQESAEPATCQQRRYGEEGVPHVSPKAVRRRVQRHLFEDLPHTHAATANARGKSLHGTV